MNNSIYKFLPTSFRFYMDNNVNSYDVGFLFKFEKKNNKNNKSSVRQYKPKRFKK